MSLLLLSLLLLLLSLLGSSTALNIGISIYPGNNLWQGESLILECRVSGIVRYGVGVVATVKISSTATIAREGQQSGPGCTTRMVRRWERSSLMMTSRSYRMTECPLKRKSSRISQSINFR